MHLRTKSPLDTLSRPSTACWRTPRSRPSGAHRHDPVHRPRHRCRAGPAIDSPRSGAARIGLADPRGRTVMGQRPWRYVDESVVDAAYTRVESFGSSGAADRVGGVAGAGPTRLI